VDQIKYFSDQKIIANVRKVDVVDDDLEKSKIRSRGCPVLEIRRDLCMDTVDVRNLLSGLNVQHECDSYEDNLGCQVERESPAQEGKTAKFKTDVVRHDLNINRFILNVYCLSNMFAIDFLVKKRTLKKEYLLSENIVDQEAMKGAFEEYISKKQKKRN